MDVQLMLGDQSPGHSDVLVLIVLWWRSGMGVLVIALVNALEHNWTNQLALQSTCPEHMCDKQQMTIGSDIFQQDN